MIAPRLITLLLLVAASAFAVEPAVKTRLLDTYALGTEGNSAETAPRLLVTASGQIELKRGAGPMLPRRVYAIYNQGEKAWVYTLTNFSGKFEEPLELLYKGSVLPGAYIGAKNPYESYKLTEDYRWLATKEGEKHFLLIPSQPNILKRVIYLIPPPGTYEPTKKKR